MVFLVSFSVETCRSASREKLALNGLEICAEPANASQPILEELMAF